VNLLCKNCDVRRLVRQEIKMPETVVTISREEKERIKKVHRKKILMLQKLLADLVDKLKQEVTLRSSPLIHLARIIHERQYELGR
jgi:hypothetical protein